MTAIRAGALLVALGFTGVAYGTPESTDLEAEVRAMRQELADRKAEVESLEARVEALQQASAPPVPMPSGDEEALALWRDVHVRGRVEGDAVSVGGDVVVHDGGRVEGDAVSIGGSVLVAEGGFVGGDRVAVGFGDDLPEAASRALDDHHASGSLTLASTDRTMRWLYHRLVWMLSVAGAGIVTVGLFPERVARVAASVENRPVRSTLVGAVATGLLSLFAVLFLVLTLGIGSPLSLAVFAALGVAWLLGFVGFCQALGDRLPTESKTHGRWLALALGVMALAFAGSLPWVGWLGLLTISLMGIGASLSTRFGRT